MAGDEIHRLTTPLADVDLENLRTGDQVRLSGSVLTARDAAHKRLCDLIDAGQSLPIDVDGQVIYYVAPRRHDQVRCLVLPGRQQESAWTRMRLNLCVWG